MQPRRLILLQNTHCFPSALPDLVVLMETSFALGFLGNASSLRMFVEFHCTVLAAYLCSGIATSDVFLVASRLSNDLGNVFVSSDVI